MRYSTAPHLREYRPARPSLRGTTASIRSCVQAPAQVALVPHMRYVLANARWTMSESLSSQSLRRAHQPGQLALRYFADRVAALAEPAADFGPVTLDFAKLVKPGKRPLDAYDRLSKNGTLRHDAAQRRALAVLDDLHLKLAAKIGALEMLPSPSLSSMEKIRKREDSWFTSLYHVGTPVSKPSESSSSEATQGGVYLHGGPGCGKTFCMVGAVG